MFAEIAEVKEAIAVVKDIKAAVDKVIHLPVVTPDGKTEEAVQAAAELVKFAAEHKTTIEIALDRLVHPDTAEAEAAELKAYIASHQAEMEGFVSNAKALIGQEYQLIDKLVAAHQAAKAGK